MRISCLRWAFAAGLFPMALQAVPLQSYVVSTPAGVPGTAAGVLTSADGTNNSALFYDPAGAALDSSGNLYLADGFCIRRVSRSGTNWVVTTLAGSGLHQGLADGTNNNARFDYPRDVAVDAGGNIYVADAYNDEIRKITPIGTNWVVTTIAGTNIAGTLDGTNSVARFNSPYGITVDAWTNLYVADQVNNTIRRVQPIGTNWVVTTLAGSPGPGAYLDQTNSSARFNNPVAVVVDAKTNIYVADYGNNAIRRVTPVGTNWVVSTVAGAPSPGSSDGTNSNARFLWPQGIALDGQGRLYVSDSGNSTIRLCAPAGTNWIVTTVAGTATLPGSANGVGTNALFSNPWGVAVDSTGNLLITDNYNQLTPGTGFTLRYGRLAFNLNLSIATNHALISWSTNAAGYLLETSGSLAPSAPWSQVTSGISNIGTAFLLNTNLGPSNAFYRLHKP